MHIYPWVDYAIGIVCAVGFRDCESKHLRHTSLYAANIRCFGLPVLWSVGLYDTAVDCSVADSGQIPKTDQWAKPGL
jgi:hypothetical protein